MHSHTTTDVITNLSKIAHKIVKYFGFIFFVLIGFVLYSKLRKLWHGTIFGPFFRHCQKSIFTWQCKHYSTKRYNNKMKSEHFLLCGLLLWKSYKLVFGFVPTQTQHGRTPILQRTNNWWTNRPLEHKHTKNRRQWIFFLRLPGAKRTQATNGYF